MSLITGQPRTASVVANVPTDVLELSREAFTTLLGRYPVLLLNLSCIVAERLAARNRPRATERGTAVAIVSSRSGEPFVQQLIAATESASVRRVASLNLSSLPIPNPHLQEPTVEGVLSVLDDLLGDHGTVVTVVHAGLPNLELLLEHMDDVLFLATEQETDDVVGPLREYSKRIAFDVLSRAEVALIESGKRFAARDISGLPIIRTIKRDQPGRDIAWLGRHLSGTKLGLALGAGGAKGFAHIGVLHVLEQAGYTVDYVSGSSIGAMVGAWLALGRTAAEVEDTMRQAFTPDTVSNMFKLSMSGMSTGFDAHVQMCRETTDDRTFADLRIPLIAMAVDLDTRRPAPITDGPLWQALLATTALAGMFPPYEHQQRRLVDGVALEPVPTGAVIDAGADVTVSVNLISNQTLPSWPGQPPAQEPPKKQRVGMLATLLEVMDVTQLEASMRHAELADVTITPRFGPGSWRDFDLADLFLAAGRTAAEEQLTALRKLARPQSG